MSEKFANSYEGYTGGLLEEEVFGRCRGDWDGETYLSFRDSLEYAKNNQPVGWRVSDPASRFAGDLFSLVALKLGLDDWSELKLYGAVGTPLDIFHGVDGFFEYNGEIFTIDLTLNQHKDSYKADIVINPETSDLEVVADEIASSMSRGALVA